MNYKQKPEAKFESDLFKVASLLKCKYVKIPEVDKSQYLDKRYLNKEAKRPFDAVLITKNGNFCIECKINSNQLMRHQEVNQIKINTINKSFFVFRKRINKLSIKYQIEQDHELIFESSKIEDLIKYFLEK